MTDIRFARQDVGAHSIARALARAEEPREAVDLFLDAVASVAEADVLALALADEEGERASGFAIRGGDEAWWRSVAIDLAHDVGGIATAARERAAFTVYDTSTAAHVNRRLAATIGAKSAAFVPLSADERLVGVLVVAACAERRHFAPAVVDAVQALADEVAPVLRRMRSADALRRALEREHLVGEIARKVRSELDLNDVLNVAVTETGLALGVSRCFIRLVASGEPVPVRAEWTAPGVDPIGAEPDRLPVSNLVLLEGRTVAIGDIEDAPELDDAALGGRERLVALGSRAVLATPIVVFDELIGVFALHRAQTGAWSASDIAVAEAVAGEVGVAIHVARLLSDDERQARIQLGFFRVAEVLGSPLSLGQTFDALARAATEALGGDAAFVLEPAGDTLRLAGAYELPPRLAARLGEGIPAAQTPLADAGRKGRMIVSSLRGDERFNPAARTLLTKSGYASLCAAPVARGEGEFATVVVLFKAEREFTDDDLAVAVHLSDAARGALERSELYESERRGRRLSEHLATVGARLVTGLSPEHVTEEIATAAKELLDADAAVVRVLEGDELVVAAGAGERVDEALGTRSSSGAGLLGDVAQSRRPGQVEDALASPRLASEDSLLAHGMAASVVAPMAAPGGGLGGMLSVYSTAPRTWRADETQALAALAAMATAALANAELYRSVAEEKERSEAILGNIADGIVAVDRDGTIVLWNATAARITGVPASEAVGRRVAETLQRELASGDENPAGEREVAILRGGTEIWIALTEAVMHDDAGAVAGRVFAFSDVSAERAVETMKSEFVAAVSHELRTPLTSIYGFAETLLRRDVQFEETDRATFLGYIASESERLIRIVDDLLNVARLEAGALALDLGPVDVAEAVGAAVKREPKGDHRIVVDLPAGLVVTADAGRLGEVLHHLVANAVKFSPQGGTITIAGRPRADMVELRVVDEGAGIAPADRKRIFTKFFHRGEGAPDHGSGTGVGLFLARGLVAAMRGRLWVESEEGRGSSFVFELPASNEPASGRRG